MQFWQIEKKIAEGKVFLVFSTLFAISVRVAYYFLCDFRQDNFLNEGFLWKVIEPIFSGNQLTSMITAAVLVVSMSLRLSYINTKLILIRQKTSLPAAFMLFFFSCHPIFFITSPYLIAAAIFGGTIHSLLNNYHAINSSVAASNITILFLLGSLFVPSLLLFYISLFIGFILIRIINFKSILASLFSVIIIYAPFASYYCLTGNIENIISPINKLLNFESLPVLMFSTKSWLLFTFSFIVLIIPSLNYIINSYKEKIKIRKFLNFFIVCTVLSILLVIFINRSYPINIFIAIIPISLLLSHYFTLSKTKIALVLFFLLIIISLVICYTSLN